MWEERDPVPDDLVPRMQAAAAVADSDLDLELMVLVERSTELVGARGRRRTRCASCTASTDLLLRVAVEGEQSRVDGWIVPPEPMTVRAIPGAGARAPTTPWSATAAGSSSPTCRVGQIRLRLEPHDLRRAPAFATPTFEI